MIDNLIPWIIGILLAACVVLIGVVIYAEYQLHQPVKGEVVETRFEPAHTTTTIVTSGKVMVPVITHHPDRWFAKVRDKEDGEIKAREISRALYESVKVGDYVELYWEE